MQCFFNNVGGFCDGPSIFLFVDQFVLFSAALASEVKSRSAPHSYDENV